MAADAFTNPYGGAWAGCTAGTSRSSPHPAVTRPSTSARSIRAGVRVDVVGCYPDADPAALRAFADAGARGIVLEATGAGNANPAVCGAVQELTAAGVVVVTSTRVAAGPVVAIYGDGGGVDLLEAGAVPSRLLRPSQARMLLAALLGLHRDPRAAREASPSTRPADRDQAGRACRTATSAVERATSAASGLASSAPLASPPSSSSVSSAPATRAGGPRPVPPGPVSRRALQLVLDGAGVLGARVALRRR